MLTSGCVKFVWTFCIAVFVIGIALGFQQIWRARLYEIGDQLIAANAKIYLRHANRSARRSFPKFSVNVGECY